MSPATDRNNQLRIILVEDDPFLQMSFRELLEIDAQLSVVAMASTIDRALDTILTIPADVALVEDELNEVSSIELLREARLRGVALPIILLMTFDNDQFFFEAIRLGANGTLPKGMALSELKHYIARVVAGERVFLRPSDLTIAISDPG